MPPETNGNTDDMPPVPVRRDCKKCGTAFDTYGAQWAGRIVCLVTVCEPCTAAAHSARDAQVRAVIDAARLRRFEKIVDPFYRSAEQRARMPLDKAREVRAHVQAGRGVLAHGDTGTLKSTCLYNGAVRWLVMRGESVECLTAAQFRQRTSKASKATDIEGYIAKLAAVPWIMLDDLGNAAVGETGTEALLSLLELRLARGMGPVLVSTQYPPDALQHRFARAEAGVAIVRRLRALSSIVTFP